MKIERTPRRQFAAVGWHQKLYASINTLADIGISPRTPIRVPFHWRPYISRLKISHRMFAARCVPAIIDRGRLLSRRYRPKPRLCLRCLRVAHDAPDYWSAFVTKPHIIVVLVPKIRATAFAGPYKNQIDFIDDARCRWRCLKHQALSSLYQPSRLSSSYSLNVGLLGGLGRRPEQRLGMAGSVFIACSGHLARSARTVVVAAQSNSTRLKKCPLANAQADIVSFPWLDQPTA
jgi:hypothetical protein